MPIRDYLSDKNILKITLIIQCVLLIVGNLVAYLSYSGKYTIDIFSRLIPIIFIFDLVITLGFIIYLYIIRKSEQSINKYLKYLSTITVFCIIARISLIYIPYLGGICGWPGDTNTHAVSIFEITNTGFYTNNYYPFTHLTDAFLNIISNIPIQTTQNLSVIIYILIYLLGIYLLSLHLLYNLNNKKSEIYKKIISNIVVIISCFGMIIYIFTYTPHVLSILFIPLIFSIILSAIYVKKNEYYIILCILLIPFSLSHPAVSFYLFLLFIVYLVFCTLAQWSENKNIESCKEYILRYKGVIIIFIGMMIIFVFWSVIMNTTFYPNISQIMSQILNPANISGRLTIMTEKVDKSGLDLLGIIETGVKTYGFKIGIIFCSIVSFIYLLVNRKTNHIYTPELAGLFIITLFILFTWGVSLAGVIGSNSLSLQRFEYMINTFCPIIIGFSLFSYFKDKLNKEHTKKIIAIVMCTFCLLIIIFGFISSFASVPSPFVHQSTSANVNADFDSYHWLILYGPDGASIINQPLTKIHRILPITYLLYNDITTPSVYELNKRLSRLPTLEDHFGYTSDNHVLSLIIGSGTYIPIIEYDRLVYTKMYSSVGRMVEKDFLKLETDNSVLKLYSNKGYADIYVTI